MPVCRALGRRLSAALLLLLAGCGGAPVAPVVLVTIDTLRADHLGCYGYARATSPVLDAFAAAGTRFAEARSQAPLTAPSHASILTGTLPAWHQVLTNGDALPADVETLPERLQAAGWHTAGFVSNAVITHVVGFDQGFEHFDDTLPAREVNRPQSERLATDTIDAAIAWLAAHRSERFFVWIHLEDPHGPYTPPAADAAPFLAEAAGLAPHPLPALADQSGASGIPQYQALTGETDAHRYVARYDGEIHYVDREIGRLLDALRGWGVAPLVVITGDHGEALGEHDHWFAHGHGLTEDQLRVPLLVRGPGVPVGRVVARAVDTLDVVPTVLTHARLAVPAELRGHDLLADGAPCRPTFAQAFPDAWAVVAEGRALLQSPAGTALYDLAGDPDETRDASVADPAARARLLALVADERARPAPQWTRRSAQGELIVEQLRALGYLQ